ncbi:MAG: S-methyl-5'-thioadenosine phosphorylase [Patescibacteria group bacterium]|nr:S-methyl-5'-thioadenosine phosphorylase [Patescibacteria group bacterium]
MIGIFGGSGFYELLNNPQEVEIKTPYGETSDKIMVGEYAGKKIAFLPRHGRNHKYPPHKVPYRANVWAMKELGVNKIFGPCASGSLQPHVKPGDFVICDAYVDRTRNREDTFVDLNKVCHISSLSPYCNHLRKTAIESCRELNIQAHEKGTVVVINGPRFSTIPESRWFSSSGFEVINMTNYPEVVLANELGMCYLNVSLITDYDAGLEGVDGIKASNLQEILATFKKNNENVKQLIFKMIEKTDDCPCGSCLEKVETAKIK